MSSASSWVPAFLAGAAIGAAGVLYFRSTAASVDAGGGSKPGVNVPQERQPLAPGTAAPSANTGSAPRVPVDKWLDDVIIGEQVSPA